MSHIRDSPRLCVSLCPHTTQCNTLRNSTTLCNTLQHSTTLNTTLQYTATHCSTLQHTTTLGPHATHVRCMPLSSLRRMDRERGEGVRGVGEATSDVLVSFGNNLSLCSHATQETLHSQETVGKEACALQHTATHCNTLQQTATRTQTPHSQEAVGKEGYKKIPLCRMSLRSLNILLCNRL